MVAFDSEISAFIFISKQQTERKEINGKNIYVSRNKDANERKLDKEYMTKKKCCKTGDNFPRFHVWLKNKSKNQA